MSKENDNKIGLGVATIIGMNAMIGAGIVAMPAMLSGLVGPAGIISYALAICLAMVIGVSLAHLADLFPAKGWSYEYPAKWGGHGLGMFSAFCYLGGVIIAMGFLVQQAGVWTKFFFPQYHASILGAVILLVLTLLVLAGAEASSWGQYLIAACVLIPLSITAAICWGHFDASLVEDFMPNGFVSVVAAAPTALFTLMGFESIASLYSIVKNPKKNVARACVLAIAAVGTLYIVFAGGVLFSIPRAYFARGVEESLANVIRIAFPKYTYLSTLVLVGGLFSIIGTLHSMIWSLSTLFTDVLSKTRLSYIKRNWGPKVSVLVTASSMLLTSLFIQPGRILASTVCFIAITYVLSIALLLFQDKDKSLMRKAITFLAIIGGGIMFYYALLGVING